MSYCRKNYTNYEGTYERIDDELAGQIARNWCYGSGGIENGNYALWDADARGWKIITPADIDLANAKEDMRIFEHTLRSAGWEPVERTNSGFVYQPKNNNNGYSNYCITCEILENYRGEANSHKLEIDLSGALDNSRNNTQVFHTIVDCDKSREKFNECERVLKDMIFENDKNLSKSNDLNRIL